MTDDRGSHFEAGLEGMLAVQERNVLDDLIDVIGAVKLREAGAAPDRAREPGYGDVCKTAVRRVIDQIDAVIRRSSRSRTIRGQEALVKVVEAKPERIDEGRSGCEVPLRSGELGVSLIIRAPKGLGDCLVIYDETAMAAD